MGFGGISIWQLLIILAIVVVIFGTKKLRNMGGDLGGAISGFKKAMKEEEQTSDGSDSTSNAQSPDTLGNLDRRTAPEPETTVKQQDKTS